MSEFETQVLAEFSNVSTAIHETSTGVHKRIDKLQTELSARITGIELRLERVTVGTKNNTTGINELKSEFGKHKEEDSQLIRTESGDPPPSRRGPFSITVDDLRSLLKLLPLLVALGAGIAGGIIQLIGDDDDAPDKIEIIPERVEPVRERRERTRREYPREKDTNPDELFPR